MTARELIKALFRLTEAELDMPILFDEDAGLYPVKGIAKNSAGLFIVRGDSDEELPSDTPRPEGFSKGTADLI